MRKIKVNAIKGRNLTTGEEIDIGLLGQKLPKTLVFDVSASIDRAWGSIFYKTVDCPTDLSVVEGYKGFQCTFIASTGYGAWVYINSIRNDNINIQLTRGTTADVVGKVYVTFFFE